MIFVGIFWLNVVLLVKASGHRLRSKTGAWLLFGAATLAPLWDYGFEVRHDNVLLCGVLLMWWLGKPPGTPAGKPRRHAYSLLGALAVILQLSVFRRFYFGCR
jgi:hypothetical protein